MKISLTMVGTLLFSMHAMAQLPALKKPLEKKVGKTVVEKPNAPKPIAVPKRVEVGELGRMSPAEVAKLPAATFDRNLLLRLPKNRSWEINPHTLADKDMYVAEYFGKYQRDQQYISVYPENKYYPRFDHGQPGFLPEARYLVLKFNPEMGKRYRVQLKLKPGDYRQKVVMVNVSGRYNDFWYINDQYDEVMFDFLATVGEIKISPIRAGLESYYTKFEPLEIEKITIDKIAE